MRYIITESQYNILIEEISVEKDDFSITVDILHDGENVGYIVLEKEKGDEFTIVDAKIEPKYRNKGLYKKSIINLLEQNPEIKINSIFRSKDADFAWESLIKKLPEHIGIRKKKYDEGILYQIYIKKDEINETELMERCWKGYTQKGMKTMFGKRYPNCVKVKK